MLYAFICLFIALTSAQGSQTALIKTLQIDIENRPAGWPLNWLTDIWAFRNHDSHCLFFFWQRIDGRLWIRGSSPGIQKSKGHHLHFKTNLNYPLFISTTCGDGLWVDAFDFKLRTSPTKLVDRRRYGTNNAQGWCLSKDRGDWRHFGGSVVERTCYQTLELQAFNEVDLGAFGLDRGKVWGHYWDIIDANRGRRVLDGEVEVNDFETVLQQYFQCVQTLEDDKACESLNIAASELFDQGAFELLSKGSETDESNAALTDDMSEDSDSNDRRKL